MTRKPPKPELPRRQQATLERPWNSLKEVPHRYLLAGIWAFLRASPREQHQQARIVGAWNGGAKGLISLVQEWDPLWMEPELTSACPELGARGFGNQRKRLVAHLVGMKDSTLWKKGGEDFGTRPVEVTDILSPPGAPTYPDEPITSAPLEGELYRGRENDHTISLGNAFGHEVARLRGDDPRFHSITTHFLPEAFHDWTARQRKAAMACDELGHPFTTLGGCRILFGFVNHGIIKTASLEGGHLRLGYDLYFLNSAKAGPKGPRCRLQFLSQTLLHEARLRAPAAQTMRGLLEAGDLPVPYSVE